MKKLNLLALAAAGMLFSACSDSTDTVAEVTNPAPIEESGQGQFIALNINLPVDNSFATRATGVIDDNNYEDGNFELNDGLASEYTVKDAMLIVFRPATGDGVTEYDAKFVAAYDINPEPWKNSEDKQVTEYSTKIVEKVGTTVNAGDLALVILNRNNLVTLTKGSLSIGSTAIIANTTTFANVQSALVETTATGQTAAANMTTTGFFMANSPLTDKAGSGATEPSDAKTQTLVPITNVYETEQAARDGDAAQIYVERGMAKVTVDQGIINPTLTTKYGTGVEGVIEADLNLTIDGWVLDQTNSKSYLVRSTAGHTDFISIINADANKYRYIGISAITQGAPETYKYRTYFAKDPNYEAAPYPTVFGQPLGELNAISDVAAAGVLSTGFGNDNPQYCYENTFDVAHQSVNNTTLVRLKVTAKTGTGAAEDLYIVNGNKSVIYKQADVELILKKKALELVQAAGVRPTTGTEISTNDFTVTFSARDAAGYKNINQISFIAAGRAKIGSGTAPSDNDLTTAIKALYKDNTITGGVSDNDGAFLCYEGGVSYYTIRIKHFGDQLTPWRKADSSITPEPSSANGSYPNIIDGTQEQKTATISNYLGRYGVLRNNWYDIKVNSIKYLGEAVPADYTGDSTPDDVIDNYIAVQINVLSWAKRTQAWDL